MVQNMDLCNNSDGNIGLKVNGDLGDLEIVESSESDNNDDEETENSPRIRSLSTIPVDLIKTSSTPIFGSVQVTGSQNVQFGNATYFNGPVTIKQVISDTFGVDNASYVKTEEEDLPDQQYKSEPKNDNSVIKSFQCKLWYKLTFSALVIVLLGSICGVVVLIFSKNSQDYSKTTSFNDDPTSKQYRAGGGLVLRKLVSNIYSYNYTSPYLIILLVYSLLTMKAFIYDESQVLEQVQNKTKSRRIKHNHFDKKYKDGDDPLLIAPNHLRMVSRSEWLAQPVENELDKIRQPVPWVIITHTATESCTTQSECLFRVRLIQTFHIESRKWFDIGYNFLVGGDGSAYYGRGWDYIGAHTLGYNKYSIGIALIGTFNNEAPPTKQIEACKKLIKRGVELGKISKDYKLFAHRQLASTLSPGDKLYDIIKEWPHFVRNTTDISSLIPDY